LRSGPPRARKTGPEARPDPPRPQHTPPAQPSTRRELITAIITSQPPRAWSGQELALRLQVKPRNLLTQLGEWARLGLFTRTGSGIYALNTPASRYTLGKRQILNFGALIA